MSFFVCGILAIRNHGKKIKLNYCDVSFSICGMRNDVLVSPTRVASLYTLHLDFFAVSQASLKIIVMFWCK